MRASELAGRTVADRSGHPVGRVRDLRIPGRDTTGTGTGSVPVVGIVVGGSGRLAGLAHAWGFAEGRASGPAILRWLLRAEIRRARYVPVGAVTSWADPVRLAGRLEDYPPLSEVRE